MAITSWHEIWNGRRGELDSLKATRRYERVFRAQVDSLLDGPATLLEYAGILGLLTAYQDANGTVDLGAILRRRRLGRDGDLRHGQRCPASGRLRQEPSADRRCGRHQRRQRLHIRADGDHLGAGSAGRAGPGHGGADAGPAYLRYRPYTWLPFSVFGLPDGIN